MEEIRYVSGNMRVEGPAEAAELDSCGVSASTWGFLEMDQRTVQERVIWGLGMLVGASGDSVEV